MGTLHDAYTDTTGDTFP